MGIGDDLNDLSDLNNTRPPHQNSPSPVISKNIPVIIGVSEGPGTGADGGGGVIYHSGDTYDRLQNGTHVEIIEGTAEISPGYISWGFDNWEDKIVDISYNILGKEVHHHVHIGNNTSDAVMLYTINPFNPQEAPGIIPENNTNVPSVSSNINEYYGSKPGYGYGDFFHDFSGMGDFIGDMIINNTPNWFDGQFKQYDKSREQGLGNTGYLPPWLLPENMYLGSQYYGQLIGSKVGGFVGGDTGAYWGGKGGRFVGDVIGGIGGGVAAIVEGAGNSLGYAIATGNWIAPIDETIILGAGIGGVVVNTAGIVSYTSGKAVESAIAGRNLFTDDDINKIVDGAGDIAAFIVPMKAGKYAKIRDVSISRIDNLGANPEYTKINYGVGVYIKDSPIISITKDGIRTGGVPLPELESGKKYTAIDNYQIPHFKATLKNAGVDTTRFDTGLRIAKTTHKSGEGVFNPTEFKIFSENIPDSAKPAVLNAMKKYANKVGDVEVYGSNVQKMQIGGYQSRSVGDIEISVRHPDKFVKILDDELKNAGIGNYKIKNADTNAPKVYFGEDKGIEIFNHDNTPTAIIKNALRDYESDLPYGFKSLPLEKVEDFNIMQLPEQHPRKFSGGHILRQTENGNWDILPTHDGRYKDITDFVDISVAYYNEKGMLNAKDIIDYVQSTPDHIAQRVSSPFFHYIRENGKIPTLDEIRSMTAEESYINKLKNNGKIIDNKGGYIDDGRELLFKITKDEASSTSLKRFSEGIKDIDSNYISSIGSTSVDRFIKDDVSSTSLKSSSKDTSTPPKPPYPPYDDTSTPPKPPYIPPTPPGIPPIIPTPLSYPTMDSNYETQSSSKKKRKKKDNENKKVKYKKYKQGAAKSKRSWYVKDINKAFKDIEKQAKELEKLMRF